MAKAKYINGYYTHKPDMRSREAMLKFIEEHDTYYTMNSWNGTRGFSHCVKVHHMELPKDVEEKAWQYLQLDWDCTDFSFQFGELNTCLKMETGHKAFFNGRSGGYLVFDMPMKYIDELADPDMYPMRSLRDYVDSVLLFDMFCDSIREEFIWYLQTHDFVEEEYTVTKKRIVEKEVE